MSAPKASNVRNIACNALAKWEDGHVYAEALVQQNAQKFILSKSDRNLLNAILSGSIRNLRKLDAWIAHLRDGKLDDTTRNLLRIGLCQLHILGISEHAAVNETVNCAKKSTRGLVNAILRGSLRQKDELDALKLDVATQLSHPDWLVERWAKDFGPDNTRKLLEWNQVPAPTIFRLNPLKTNSHQILTETDHPIVSLPNHPDFFVSEGLPPKGWINDGLIYIQDPATSHSVDLLAPFPGEHVLDACAAPGGKSTQIAAYMQNAGTLLCTDSNEKRLPRLLDNLKRLGVSIATTEAFNWTDPAPEKWHNSFDAILLDVPCSNTGVLRRRVDARWRLNAEQITELTEIQTKILENSIACLKPGGRVVYSTCSIDKEENTDLIHAFVAKHPEVELVDEQQITPFEHETDGAYAALIHRKE